MSKRHPVRNSQFMKAIRDVHSFSKEESWNIKNNHPLYVYVALKTSGSTVRAMLKECSLHVNCYVNTCLRCVISFIFSGKLR
jgi:hypothetical protein